MKNLFLIVIVLGMAGIFSACAEEKVVPTVFEQALMEHETVPGGNDMAIGDRHLVHKAYGCLQIRKGVCDDINNRYGTHYRPEDCLGNRELSIKLCRLYLNMWATEKRLGHKPTAEDFARIWNGGPNGYQKSSTEQYWAKVRPIYQRLLARR